MLFRCHWSLLIGYLEFALDRRVRVAGCRLHCLYNLIANPVVWHLVLKHSADPFGNLGWRFRSMPPSNNLRHLALRRLQIFRLRAPVFYAPHVLDLKFQLAKLPNRIVGAQLEIATATNMKFIDHIRQSFDQADCQQVGLEHDCRIF